MIKQFSSAGVHFVQVISISSLKGGVGKTSATLGLASAAMSAGIPTLVVDMDPHADATTGLGVRQDAPGLDVGTLLQKPKRYQVADHANPSGWLEIETIANKQGDNPAVIDVLRGSSKTSLFERTTTRRRELIRLSTLLESATKYGLVLIDCPPALNGVTRMAWAASTDVLLIAEPSLFSVAGTERSMRALDLFQREHAPRMSGSHVLLNRVRAASTEHKYRLSEMRRMFGERLLPLTIPEVSNWQQIQGAAWPVHAWPGESASRAAKLFDEVLENLTHQAPAQGRRFRRGNA